MVVSKPSAFPRSRDSVAFWHRSSRLRKRRHTQAKAQVCRSSRWCFTIFEPGQHLRWLHLARPDRPLLSYSRSVIPPAKVEQQKKLHLCLRSTFCATQINPRFLQTLGPAKWLYMVAIDLTSPGASHGRSLNIYTFATPSPRPRPTLPPYPPPQPPPEPSRRTSIPSCSSSSSMPLL
jgi:hypothetical protein